MEATVTIEEDQEKLQQNWAELKRALWKELGPPILRFGDWLNRQTWLDKVPPMPQWMVYVSPFHWFIWFWTGKRPML